MTIRKDGAEVATGDLGTADGRAAIFHSAAGNLVGNDLAFTDVFVRDLCKP